MTDTKLFTFKDIIGNETEGCFYVGEYYSGGTFLELLCVDDDNGLDSYADVSINLPQEPLMDDYIWVPSENDYLARQLVSMKFLKDANRTVSSGYGIYSLYEINWTKMEPYIVYE